MTLVCRSPKRPGRERRGARCRPLQRRCERVDEIVARAHDAAQAHVVAGGTPDGWARLIADADHALLAGDPVTAYALSARAAS
ncbi:hypothetical protein ABT009_24355 [Streptomyces sp. NPDC002896]|uniref:hypothetical protein n=1 Tax=Streptomyces sp. NPDC002896 TaxID=3154438 RepID=UPI00332C1892